MPARGGDWNGSKWIKPAKRQAIYDRDGHRCVYCGGNGDDSNLTLEHLISVVLGGGNSARELITACLSCNCSRGKKSLKAFLNWLKEKKGIDPKMVRARIRKQIAKPLVGYNERMRRAT